ncbi:DNA primase [Streptomyces phage Annadreamy]|uniref:DNA primase n=2 Tax=Annadreamyvirus annadreamy TaxID=2846392 RepID=A0A345GTA4_9CAUD|nr:DNA primase [Streptomyces phage Annadreamy]AXG66176.1 DNA primase [Streptomyces phage Annadreamy]QGH79388.1 DNA primase [Streptomyces phage Limpid]
MGSRGDFEWEGNKETYTPNQVEATLRACGVEIEGETTNDFLCFCPFHGNRFSPSFSVSRTSGAFICFNHSCGITGTLVDLVKRIPMRDGTFRNEFAARRLILKKKSETQQAFEDELNKLFEPKVDFVEFPQVTLDRMYEDFWQNPEAIRYMVEERGFEEETLEFFRIGYSAKKDIIAVPMHNAKGLPVGVIGRPADTENKFFKNSRGLPTSKTLWNMHRAKRHGATVIICEASFDAMRIHQAGYPNVVACLGGNFSPYHFDQLNKHFSTIVIMTDFDKKEKHIYKGCRKCKKRGLNLCVGHNPGRDLGGTIAAGLNTKTILWASYGDETIYPHDAKDAGDMTDDEIRQCLRNAVPDYTYAEWGIY